MVQVPFQNASKVPFFVQIPLEDHLKDFFVGTGFFTRSFKGSFVGSNLFAGSLKDFFITTSSLTESFSDSFLVQVPLQNPLKVPGTYLFAGSFKGFSLGRFPES